MTYHPRPYMPEPPPRNTLPDEGSAERLRKSRERQALREKMAREQEERERSAAG